MVRVERNVLRREFDFGRISKTCTLEFGTFFVIVAEKEYAVRSFGTSLNSRSMVVPNSKCRSLFASARSCNFDG